MAEIVNGRCHAERAPFSSPPLIQNGKLVLQVSSAFTAVAMGVSFWLIHKHLRSYTNKYEQRYIVRILFMVPLYALISLASYFWWNHSTPLLLVRDCYESTVLTAFFYLLLLYISPDPNIQKEVFRKNGLSREHDRRLRKRGEQPQKWMLPLGFVRWKPEDGLYFLQLMKWGVLQYCVVRPTTTLAAVILDYVGLYCEDSWSPGWGHIYITLVVSLSVSVAMYCLIQLYMAVKVELAPQKPLLKLIAIKAVVFLTFWQATFLSVLTLFGIVKDTPYMTADNINIGIGAIAETFEMACFALLHVKAFSCKPYYDPEIRTPQWQSLVHAMSFKETIRELWAGMIYMVHRSRGVETDPQARREAALEDVFGRSRIAIRREASMPVSNGARLSEKDLSVTVEVEKEVHVNNERQWLGVGDDYIYGLGYQSKPRRGRSDGLEEQIEKELTKRGYGLRSKHESGADYAPVVDADAPISGHGPRQTSWWRRIYNRLSQSGPDPDVEQAAPPGSYSNPSRRSSTCRRSKDVPTRAGATRLMQDVQEDVYDEPPPPSAIRTYRESKNKMGGVKRKPPPTLDPPLLSASFADVPSPLSSPNAGERPLVPIPQHSSVAPWRDPTTVLSSPPLPSPAAESFQADSFLDRAFAASIEPASSAEALSSRPSSQSHHTHVKLGPHPHIVTKMKALPETPLVVDPGRARPSGLPPAPMPTSPQEGTQSRPIAPVSPLRAAVHGSPTAAVPSIWVTNEPRGRTRTSHRRDSAQFLPEHSISTSPPMPKLRLQRASVAYSRGAARQNSAAPQYSPPNRFVPTRDKIVLPAPLGTASTRPGATGQTFASPRYSPPGLPAASVPQGRRWTAPYPAPSAGSPR
ncbi:organic solute transporter Ostalpha-domain-containing protein [Cubamyces lactineus]|nr:organic solute transporter Ostalpha-domain-containing protein [Cubamyces lactineus]